MQLLYPYALLALLGLPLFIWLALRRQQYRPVLVASLTLWQMPWQQPQQQQRQQQHFRLLLLLQVFNYLLLVLAMTQPCLVSQERTAQVVTIVLDNSASMQTRSVWVQALQAVRTILASLGTADRVTLYTYPGPGTYQRLSPAQLKQQLRKLRPVAAPSNSRAVLDFAQRLAATPPCFLITDGTGADLVAGSITLVLVGCAVSDNIGFVELAVEKDGVFLAIFNASHTPRSTLLQIKSKGHLLQQVPLQIPARTRQSCWLPAGPWCQPQEVLLELSLSDNLSLDNRVYLRRYPALQVCVAGKATGVLQRVFTVLTGVRLISPKSTQADLWVGPATDKPPMLKARTIVLLPPYSQRTPPALVPGAPVAFPQPVAASDPLLHSVYPELLSIPQARPWRSWPAGYRSLINCSQGSLLGALQGTFYFAFRPEQTNWPGLPSFPIFWRNLVNAISPLRGRLGTRRTTCHGPWHIGWQRSSQGQEAVSLLSLEETDNQGRHTPLARRALIQPACWRQQRTPLWPGLVLLALLTISAAWFWEYLLITRTHQF